TAELAAVEQAARAIDARMSHDDEPTPDDHPDGPRSRVTLELPASMADSAMRALGAVATGTPTIEIVTARDPAAPGRSALPSPRGVGGTPHRPAEIGSA